MRWILLATACVLVGCASVNAALTGSNRQIVLSGTVLSSGGPYELREVANGAVTSTVVARSSGASGGQLRKPDHIPVSVSFDLPVSGPGSDARCLAIVDHTDAPVQIRRKGQGVGLFAFSNPAWTDFSSYSKRLENAQGQRDEAARRLDRLKTEGASAERRLTSNRAHAAGACTMPAQAPEPPRPQKALDPSVRTTTVNQICERVAQQRLGCNVYVNMMRQMGLPASILACGQNRTVVPPDALTGWADYFENSFVQGCINNGNPISCGLAKSTFQSRQEHCQREVARPYVSAYNSWNTQVREIRAEPGRTFDSCLQDTRTLREGPSRIVSQESVLSNAEQTLARTMSGAPTVLDARDLSANTCS